jgi:hypothetical protein
MVKRGRAAVVVCSTAFTTLGRAQASAMGEPKLPIAVIPHPFGLRSRDEVRTIAEQCVDEVARLVTQAAPGAHRARET